MEKTEAEFECLNKITMDASFQSPIQKKDISTINDYVYNESNDQVDTISYSKENFDPISDPRVDTDITDGIQKLSIIPITFEPVIIGKDLVASVQETLRDRLLRESLKTLHTISSKEIVTDAACNSVQVDRIVRNPIRAIHRTSGVNLEVFSPSRVSNSSFAKWSRNIDPLNTYFDGSAAQERNSDFSCIEKMGVKSLPGEIVTDLDPIKRVNLASSVLRKSPKFINFGLPSFNATGKPNSVFAPSTRAKRLNGTERENLNGDSLASSHYFERVSETRSYSNHINNSELETRQVFERENIQTENIPMTQQTDFVTPLHDNQLTRSIEISKNGHKADKPDSMVNLDPEPSS